MKIKVLVTRKRLSYSYRRRGGTFRSECIDLRIRRRGAPLGPTGVSRPDRGPDDELPGGLPTLSTLGHQSGPGSQRHLLPPPSFSQRNVPTHPPFEAFSTTPTSTSSDGYNRVSVPDLTYRFLSLRDTTLSHTRGVTKTRNTLIGV